ncbi:SCO0930 family lipoprotein [Streptomyces pathocidini]|uniref:SCO0930 family lipoprotein n=1 Tax=Streptomyces pathocidini TaxID=1650571 RepID=A0ABW7UNU2_9ACTN
MRKNWRHVATACGAAAMLLVTACGTEGSKADGTELVQPAAGSGSAKDGAGGEGEAPKPGKAGQLAVRSDGELGPLVTDSAGMTLYRFDKDTADPPASTCEGECAAAWPPVAAGDASASADLNPELLGSVSRSDGSQQLTLGGWPLYRFAKDTEPGDTKGQNVGGTWFASAPDGKKAGAPRPALGVFKSPELGEVLTDRNGRTLYLFTKDTPWPMKTACDEKCLEKWTPAPPVSAADAKAAGVDPDLLFTFTTPDGTQQEAVNCWPAYTFKGDTAPGQTNGQGVGGSWFAIKKDAENDRGRTVPAAKAEQAPEAGADDGAAPGDGGTSGSGSSSDGGSNGKSDGGSGSGGRYDYGY